MATRVCSLQLQKWRCSNSRRFYCSVSSNHLLARLIESPISQLKLTLDSLHSSRFQDSVLFSDNLLVSLHSSSPNRAHMVLEWRLEKMINENQRDHRQYSNLISLCGKLQRFPLAIQVFTSMEARGMKPNPSVFNSLIEACFSSGNLITAISLFEIMSSSDRYHPDSETYENFIKGFSDIGNVESMKAWFQAKIAAKFPINPRTYEYLVAGCVKAGDFDGADKFYNEMISSGIMPSVLMVEKVLEGLCKRKNLSRLKEFLTILIEDGFKVNGNMAENMVKLCNQLWNIEEMENILDMLMEANQAGECLSILHNGIIRMYALSDRLDDVEYAVGRMLMQEMSFTSPDVVEKIVSSYFRNEAYDRLDLFLERIKDSYKLERSTLDLLVAGYRRSGLTEKLELLMGEYMKLANEP